MKFGELSKRIVTAVVGVPILIFALVEGGYVLLTLVAFVTVIGLWEFFHAMELRGYKPVKTAGYLSGLVIVFSAYLLKDYFLILFLVLLFILFISLFEKDNKTALSGTGGTIFGVFYIAGLLSFAIKLRELGTFLAGQYKSLGSFLATRHIDDKTGIYAIFFPIAIIFISDTGAYFVGKAYGKRRVAPAISPKKSWEGVLGGIAASLVAAYVIWRIAPDRFPLGQAVILSVILSIAGLAGDLVESRIKRDAGVKDSGTIFPGHGGIMDRIDALLFGLPIAYIYFLMYFRFIFSR
jgi:phosphatidate cytidylyltransferase